MTPTGKRPSRSDWSARQRLKNDVLFHLTRAFLRGSLALPLQCLAPLGRMLGNLAYLLCRSARTQAYDNLALVFPQWSRDRRRALARQVFQTLGGNLTDTLRLFRSDERADSTLALSERSATTLRQVLERRRGAIYVTAHLGPWERMAALLSANGFPITTVARESYDRRFHGVVYDPLRAKRGVEAIYRGQPGAPADPEAQA